MSNTDNFNLINFKRGTLAALQSLNTAANRENIEEGTFYLTLEEGTNAPESARLFIGRNIDGTKKIVPVNQGIITVADTTALNNLSANNFQTGDFAYITDGNILAVKSGQGWIQINQAVDNYLVDLETAITGNDGGVKTITTTGEMTTGLGDRDTSFSMTGADGISISSSGTALTISGNPYELNAGAVNNDEVTIKLQSDSDKAADPDEDSGSVTLKAGANVTLANDANNNIVIGAIDTVNESVSVTNGATSGFTVTVTDSSDKSGSFDPKISYLTNQAGTTSSEVSFIGGTAALPVYSKAEVDRRIGSLTGMHYAGTINQSTAIAQTTGHVGDTYKASEAFTANSSLFSSNTPSSNGIVSVKAGDLLIVSNESTNTDGEVTSGLKFDLVPSGDETVLEYTIDTGVTNGAKLHEVNGAGRDLGGLKLDAPVGSQIALSQSVDQDNIKTVSISHASITTSETTGTAIASANGAPTPFTAVTGLTIGDNGHVTAVETSQITITDNTANVSNVAVDASAANDIATISTSVTTTDLAQHDVTKSDNLRIASDNLTVTATAASGSGDNKTSAQVKMNFVWGEF